MMPSLLSRYSLTSLILFPLTFLIIVFTLAHAWLHSYNTEIIHRNLLEHISRQTLNQLMPSIQEHINDHKSLMIYLREVIQSDSGVFYIGLTTQGKHYAHASAPRDVFKEEPFYFQETLPKYPEITLELVINAKPINSFLKSSERLQVFSIILTISTLLIGVFLIIFLLTPLKRLAHSLREKTKSLNQNLSKPSPNETLSIAHSFRAISSSQRSQKRSLKKLNLHLGEIIDAKTFSLKAEIDEKTEAKQKLELSNEEKTILLKEVHHRVKNNLAIVVGLIRMQSRRIDDTKTKSMFRDLQNRIKTMELIHTNLYASTQFSRITMKNYLESLVEYLSNSFSRDDEVVMFSVHCDEITMDIDKAITCGQIVNELVTNAFKHAFKDNNGGHIWIQINDLGDYYELLVEDNGASKAQGNESETIQEKFSLGLSLVHELVRYQLKGSVDTQNQNGLKYCIVFKK